MAASTLLLGLAVSAAPAEVRAQDPMAHAAGQALVDPQLPGGTVVVRLGLHTLSQPVVDTAVTLTVLGTPGAPRSARTDANGRATFKDLPAGARVRAAATVAGERLETAELAVEASAGVRTMMVFAAGEAAAAPAAGAAPAARQGGGALPAGHPPVAGAGGDEDDDATESPSFDAGVPVGTARSDDTVARGTVQVRVLDAGGAPVAGHEVSLLEIRPGGLSIKKATTGADGLAKLAPTAGASGYAVALEHQGLRLSTRPFTLPADKGIRVELQTLAVTTDPTAVTVPAGGRVIVQLREDSLQIMEALPLEASPGKLFAPRGEGLALPLPAGFVGAQAIDSSRIKVKEGHGVVLQGPIPPAGTRGGAGGEAAHASFGFFLKTGRARSFTVRQPMPHGIGPFALIVQKQPGVEVQVEGALGPAEDREGGGLRYTMTPVGGVAPGGELVFTVSGLPAPDTTPSFIAGGLALLIALGATIAARRPGGAPDRSARRRELERKRDELMNELVDLQKSGAADSRTAARREKLMTRLEPLYRELSSLEDGRLP